MNKENCSKVEIRYRGYSLPENQLPSFLTQLSEEICAAWQQEYEDNASQPLGIDNYRRIASKIGHFSNNVIETAFTWYQSQNENKKKIGGNILGHHSLKSTLFATERIKKHYPNIEIDENELMISGLVTAQEVINNLKQEHIKQLSTRINTYVFREGERILISTIDLALGWEQTKINQQILLFKDKYAEEKGHYPTTKEIIKEFCLKGGNNATVIQKFVYSDPKDPLVSKTDPAQFTSKEMLRAQIDDVLNVLTKRQKEIVGLYFGLIDGIGKNVEEIAKELQITPQWVYESLIQAFKQLRHPKCIRKLKDYLE